MADPTNTPMPPGTPVRSTSPPCPKPRVLHIGDPVKYNPDTYAAFTSQFDIIRPSAEEREREAFATALKVSLARPRANLELHS